VLITGETGTGKELVAQLIQENSTRRDCPFVCLNSAAIPEALVESELFGYEKGAFTGALSAQEGKLSAANRGTVFFDEIGDVSPGVQAKLLRAIESKQLYRLGSNRSRDLDIRILAASNQDLEAAIKQNRFRGDLYYRLNVLRIEVPPLRDRLEDLPVLVDHYVRRFSRTFRKHILGCSEATMDLLLSYSWPGNIRELKNVLEAAFVTSSGPDGLLQLPGSFARSLSISTRLKSSERTMILQALTATNWNRTEAAKRLQWSRMTLYRKMSRYQVSGSVKSRL
jgi:transcriptional regulator with PAS, ATPase and Fis domain